MTNWQCGKYNSIIALQDDAAKNSLWRAPSSASGASTPTNSFTDRQAKTTATKHWPKSNKNDTKQWSKAPKWSSKGGASADSKGKSFDSKKRKVALEKDKPFESWNKAKDKLTEEEYNKRRRTKACINCGEVGHKFSDCSKPKP